MLEFDGADAAAVDVEDVAIAEIVDAFRQLVDRIRGNHEDRLAAAAARVVTVRVLRFRADLERLGSVVLGPHDDRRSRPVEPVFG